MLARLGLGALIIPFIVACDGRLGGLGAGQGGDAASVGDDGDGGEPAKLKDFNTQEELLDLCDALGEGIHPGDAPLRRLTRAEYNQTIADLLGDASAPGDRFPPEGRALGFNGIAEAQTVTTLLAEGYQSAAQEVAARAVSDHQGLLGCDAAQVGCIEDFVGRFGGLAYRRPLSSEEIARFIPVFEWGRDNQTIEDGIEMVLEVMLQSPDFLYRPEFGTGPSEGGVVALSGYEMATRLGYLFLGSLPDAELRAAAEADELRTPEQVLAQAERLLEAPESRRAFESFHTQWLELEEVHHIERDADLYEGYTSDIPHLFVEETLRFVEHVLFEDDASLQTLLTAPYTIANAELAGFYGLDGASGAEFERVTLDSQRAGLLTQGSLLAHHAQPLQTSPTHRGLFIREAFLCQFPPAPPDDLIIMPPDLDPNLTTRERFAQHSADTECAGCHELMDPLGLGFEHFDPVGRYREDENGLPIDASGELIATDVDGPFYGAVELGEALASSEQTAGCLTKQWMRYGYGRSESGEDACSLAQLRDEFSTQGHNIQKLVLALTQTDAFRYRKEVTP